MRILIVEDDRIGAAVLRQQMEKHGVCTVVGDGYSAIEAFHLALAADCRYDLICVDILIPGIDGQEVLKRIRNHEAKNGATANDRAKILMVTGKTDFENVLKAIENMCDGYIAKPVSAEEIELQLKELGLLET